MYKRPTDFYYETADSRLRCWAFLRFNIVTCFGFYVCDRSIGRDRVHEEFFIGAEKVGLTN